MRLAVLVKQVPDVTDLRLDPVTRTLVREGVAAVMNMHDRTALTAALRLRDERGGEVVVVSMGPPQATAVLRESLATGADRAVLLSDRALAGSDTLVTARVLTAALARLGPFDLVLGGDRSTDSETGQVGPEVAALLGVPQVTGVHRLELRDRTLVAVREVEEGVEDVEVPLPALVTVVESMCKPRRVPRDALAAVDELAVERWDLDRLGLLAADVGLEGSPTVVVGIRPDAPQRVGHVFRGVEAAPELIEALVREGAFEDAGEAALPPPPPVRRGGTALVVVAESEGGRLHRSVVELIAEASRAAGGLGGRVVALAVGGGAPAATLAASGADEVVIADGVEDTPYGYEVWCAAVEAVLEAEGAVAALVAPATPRGRDFLPRLAAARRLGMVGDAVGLEVDHTGRLLALKPAFGGAVVAPVAARTRPLLTTIRPGTCTPFAPDAAREVPVHRLPAPAPRPAVMVVGRRRETARPLAGATRVVCVGYGVGGPEGVAEVARFADELGAVLGATRRVVESGWVPRSLQVGVSGHALVARLYLGVGVRGAANHLAGLRRVKTVVAVNADPRAPIFAAADYGLVADWRQGLEALRAALEARGSGRRRSG